MKKKFFKRGAAYALSAVMALSIVPTISPLEKVEAASKTTQTTEKEVLGLGVTGISDPTPFTTGSSTSTSWRGSYVYYGQFMDQPLKFRVLDTESQDTFKTGNTKSILLDSDRIITDGEGETWQNTIVYNHGSGKTAWLTSGLRSWLNDTSVYDSSTKTNNISYNGSKTLTGFFRTGCNCCSFCAGESI